MADRYRLNVDPDVVHELTDAEVRDLTAFGFQVTRVNGRAKNGTSTGSADEKNGAGEGPADEKKGA